GEPLCVSPSHLPHRVLRWFRREPALAWRWTGLAAGAVIVHVNHLLVSVEEPNYPPVMMVLALWAALSFVLQRRPSSERIGPAAPYAWATLDVAAFTALVCLAEGPRDVLLAGYP